MAFPGMGTLVNVLAVLVGTVIGVLAGHRLRQQTRDVVTDGIGLVTLLIAATAAMSVRDRELTNAVGDSAPMLIVLGALIVGGVTGSLLRIEDRLERFGGWLQAALERRLARRSEQGTTGTTTGTVTESTHRQNFIEGFVTASLVFCVGPLTILGSINDGLGNGAEQLYLKSALDGLISIAFAASLGWGVGASVLALVTVQGSLTVLGAVLGDILPAAHISALTAAGGLMLVGVALRLLRIRQVPVGDLLPGLVVAPLLTAVAITFQ
jgi:uncharacterized membrane protein YqgA involved in biofilm formation